MKDRSRYVFGAALAGVAMTGVPGLVNRAHAALVTNGLFSFESNGGALPSGATTATSVTTSANVVYGPLAADSGTGSAFGFHLSTTGYSTPAGNGSAHSFSSSTWSVGDYYQFSVPTTAIQGIMISFSQISSATGPSQFVLQYSTDGTSFSAASAYTIPFITFVSTNSTGGTATASSGFSTNASNGNFVFAFDLSSVTGLNNDPNAIFRVVDNGTQALNGTASVAAGGTDRVDDFAVSGSAVPEPAAVSLLTAAAAAALIRRRRA